MDDKFALFQTLLLSDGVKIIIDKSVSDTEPPDFLYTIDRNGKEIHPQRYEDLQAKCQKYCEGLVHMAAHIICEGKPVHPSDHILVKINSTTAVIRNVVEADDEIEWEVVVHTNPPGTAPGPIDD
jgi:hypothetical protein